MTGNDKPGKRKEIEKRINGMELRREKNEMKWNEMKWEEKEKSRREGKGRNK